MSTREQIAAVLSTVAGVDGLVTAPDVPGPGSGWPAWTGAVAGTYTALVDTWHVFVCLPNANLANTVEAADPLVDQVWAALLDVGEPSNVEPVTLTIGDPAGTGSGVPALRFTLTTTGSKT